MLIHKWLTTLGRYLMLMGRTFSRPERMRMFLKQYVNEMAQLGINSIGIVLIISFFIGAVICIQMKLNIQSPWMPRWVSGYTTREILLLEFSSSIMCLILAGKVGSNIASELGTMRVTQQIDALEIMGVNSACYLILPKIMGMLTIMPILVIFSSATGILGAYATAYIGHILPPTTSRLVCNTRSYRGSCGCRSSRASSSPTSSRAYLPSAATPSRAAASTWVRPLPMPWSPRASSSCSAMSS